MHYTVNYYEQCGQDETWILYCTSCTPYPFLPVVDKVYFLYLRTISILIIHIDLTALWFNNFTKDIKDTCFLRTLIACVEFSKNEVKLYQNNNEIKQGFD
jgi:hypothetical protein